MAVVQNYMQVKSPAVVIYNVIFKSFTNVKVSQDTAVIVVPVPIKVDLSKKIVCITSS